MSSVRRWLATLALVLIALFVVLDWTRFRTDFWPPDRSYVGPNLLAALVQAGFVMIVVVLVYPPTRRAVERFIKGHFDEAHAKVRDEVDVIHQCLDHIITHHPDIPEFHPLGRQDGTGTPTGSTEQTPSTGVTADPPVGGADPGAG